jgi:pyruvate/2-oxoglutarate dehydrogenase complex dihydrolipoamide acyltransferase (E2) component
MRMELIGKYRQEKYSLLRRLIAESQYHLLKKHYMKGIFDIDVTECRKAIRQYRAEKKKKLSLLAFLIKCIGTAIAQDRSVQALKKGDTLITFDDIDISLTMEVEINGNRMPRNYIVRKVNEKSLAQISDEIEDAKRQNREDAQKSISADPNYRKIKLLFLLPSCIRRLVWKRVADDPLMIKKMLGTVGLTSIAMFIQTSGWAELTRSFFSVHFIIGSIAKKPVLTDGKIHERQYLSVSVLFDHDVVDGGPATRLIARLSELVQKSDLNM